MTPEYRATEFSFQHVGVDTYPAALTEHIRDHTRNNWRIQQIFKIREYHDDQNCANYEFGVLWVRGSTPEDDALIVAMQLR